MTGIPIGTNRQTGQPFRLPYPTFSTHYHVIGATGKGKTTFLITLLAGLLRDPGQRPAVFILDRMGGFSLDLLRFFSSPYCPESVRERLVYIQTARTDRMITLNPLHYTTPEEGDFRIDHTTELVLRGMAQTDIGAMPRLKNWTGTTLLSDLTLGLTLADSMHFLLPGSPLRDRLIGLLPEQLRFEWGEVTNARAGSQASVLLESTRNRLKPFWTQTIPRIQFASTINRFDVLHFLRSGSVVLVDLSPHGKVSDHMADCQAGMILNEILTTVRSLPPGQVYPAFLVLDEFQRYVGPDIFNAIPEVRQKAVRLVLSHQTYDQLERNGYDLTGLIFQCQSRVMLGVSGPDAGILADEIASLRFDPLSIKDEIRHCSQRTVGHKIVELASRNQSASTSSTWGQSSGTSFSTTQAQSRRSGDSGLGSSSAARGQADQWSRAQGGGHSDSTTTGSHETLVPVLEDFWQVSSRSYYSFDEQRNLWAQSLRRLKTGQALIVLANDPVLHEVDIDRLAVGALGLDWAAVQRKLPGVVEAVERLVEENFQRSLFVTPHQVERETSQRLQRLLHGGVLLRPTPPSEDQDRPVRLPDSGADDQLL